MKKKVYVLRTLITFVMVAFLVFANFTPAYAWKVKTHVYSANLIIDEINKNNGYVEIKPFGKFQVAPEYRDLIRVYPDFYRAGAIGPDLFSDIIIGQTIIHTGNDMYTSGELIEVFWDAAKNLPEYSPSDVQRMIDVSISSTIPIDKYNPKNPNDPANQYLRVDNKMQAKAFMLGYMAHAAGDYFGHSYVNHWAGGTWPNVADGLTQAEKDIIRKHSVIEAYVDSMIPQEYKSDSKNAIKIPQRFIFDNMLVTGNVNISNMANDDRRAEKFGSNGDLAPHLDLFFTIRDALRKRINKINKNASGNILDKIVYGVSLQFAQKAYCEAWIEDIDKGLGAWVAANERAARQMIAENGNMDKYFDELKKWADKHALSMLGAPDVAVDITRAIGSISDFIDELLPEVVVEAIEKAKKNLINFMIKESTGIDIEEYKKLLNPPLSDLTSDKIFPSGSFHKLNQEMGNFNTSTDSSNQTFIPFANTLTLMKLTLIGEAGIQELRNRAGSSSTNKLPWYTDTITEFIYNLDYGYNWEEETFSTSTFLLSRNNEDFNKVTRVIFNTKGFLQKPGFSDMKKGPISVVTNLSYAPGEVPKIKVKYNNAPDQVNALIGLFPSENFSSNSATSWKDIARNTSGEYEVSAPLKGGKYHFRIYDNENNLLATSEIIEVIEVSGELRSYFEEIPAEPFEPRESLAVNFINNLKKKGFIALYKDNETNPQKIIGSKYTLSEKSSLHQILTSTPAEPGSYRYRAYDENMVLIAQSSLIIVAGSPDNDIIAKPDNPDKPNSPVSLDIKTINVYDILDYEGQNGEVFYITVTGKIDGGTVWGSGIYTNDSDVETAAVHAGIVKVGETKTIKITILPGQSSYEGTIRNGVRTKEYEDWYGSFRFTDVPLPLTPQNPTGDLNIYEADDIDLSEYRGLDGTELNVIVTGSLDGSVWGSGIYTDDSDISTAAVHAGLVKVGETKTVKITILPGQNSYVGTIKNGVESSDYGEWEGSYKFSNDAQPTTP